jgi:hypothetical protein
MFTYPLMNPCTKAAKPIKTIWNPEVALADLALIGKYKRAVIITVPDPTPKTPWANPAPNPPRAM